MPTPKTKETPEMEAAGRLARALSYCFVSPNVCDSNLEAANIVDVLATIGRGSHRIADALDNIAKAMNKQGGE